MTEYVGMARNEAGLNHALEEIEKLKKEFYANVRIPAKPILLMLNSKKATACRRLL